MNTEYLHCRYFVFGNVDTQRYFDPVWVWVWQIWQQAGGWAGVSSCEGCWSMDGRGLDTRNAWLCMWDGRTLGWGHMGGAEERAPAPAQQHTGLSVAPQLAHSEHLRVIVTPSLHDSNDYIVSDTNMSVLWYWWGMLGAFLWRTKLGRMKDSTKSSDFINIQIQDVIEIQDKSLFKVQKASQVEKFTIVVGWRSISSKGRRRLLSTRSWFIPGNLSQPSFKALCGVNFSSAFNQNPLRRGVYEWCSEVYNWFCWMMKWNIWNQSSWVSGIGCQTILYCKIVSIRPRLACFICNQFEQ